jgi:septal ring factor EnvC (AmiA/AmiB activator)
MDRRNFQPNSLIIYIIFLYWTPIILLCLNVSSQLQWWLVIMTLCVSSIGAIALYLLLVHWEKNITKVFQRQQASAAESKPCNAPLTTELTINPIIELEKSLAETQKEKDLLIHDLEDKSQQLITLQNEQRDLKEEMQLLHSQLVQLKTVVSEQQALYKNSLLNQERLSADHQKTLNDKQKQMEALENKIRELNYEIKTLLKIGPSTASM